MRRGLLVVVGAGLVLALGVTVAWQTRRVTTVAAGVSPGLDAGAATTAPVVSRHPPTPSRAAPAMPPPPAPDGAVPPVPIEPPAGTVAPTTDQRALLDAARRAVRQAVRDCPVNRTRAKPLQFVQIKSTIVVAHREGRLVDAEVVATDLGDRALRGCLLQKTQEVRFPVAVEVDPLPLELLDQIRVDEL